MGERAGAEEEVQRAEWLDEVNRAAEEALANPIPTRVELIESEHPMAERAFELAARLAREVEGLTEPVWLVAVESEVKTFARQAGRISRNT